MVPFDVVSLYTNVSLRDMLQICTNVLYKGHLGSALNLFSEFMRLATEGVELSFNNTMYAQIDWVSMGSPLGPVLANISCGFYEGLFFEKYSKPHVYLRYIDDTFSIFDSINDAEAFSNPI